MAELICSEKCWMIADLKKDLQAARDELKKESDRRQNIALHLAEALEKIAALEGALETAEGRGESAANLKNFCGM